VDPSLVDGLTDYYLISFQSAADFVLTIDETKLKIDPSEFRERLERSEYTEFLIQKKGVLGGGPDDWLGKPTSVWELLWSKEEKRWEALLRSADSREGEESAELREMAKKYRQLSQLVEEMLTKKGY
jgi:hypothetical protein